MYCSQCGMQLDNNAKFCTKCGSMITNPPSHPDQNPSFQQTPNTFPQQTPDFDYPQNPAKPVQQTHNHNPSSLPAYQQPQSAAFETTNSSYKLKDVNSTRYTSIIIAVIMLALSFTKIYSVSFGSNSASFYAHQMLENGPNLSEMGLYAVYFLIMTVVSIIIPITLISYLYTEFSSNNGKPTEFTPVKGCSSMVIVIVSMIVSFVVMKLTTFPLDSTNVSLGYSTSGYIIIIAAAINRFCILPSYISIVQNNRKAERYSQKQSSTVSANFSSENKPKSPGSFWECTACGEINPITTPSCKACGKYK